MDQLHLFVLGGYDSTTVTTQFIVAPTGGVVNREKVLSVLRGICGDGQSVAKVWKACRDQPAGPRGEAQWVSGERLRHLGVQMFEEDHHRGVAAEADRTSCRCVQGVQQPP